MLVYDKRDDFPFDIVNFPHISGNISKNCMYGVFKSQIIRYFNICTHEESFRCRSGMLFNILVDKGYNKSILIRNFKALVKSYFMDLKFKSIKEFRLI